MRLDSTLAFVPYGTPLSMVGADGVAIASNTIDLLGSGVGTAPANIIGNATLFGADMGVGDGFLVPKLAISPGTTAWTTGNAATLNIALQLSADTAVTYQPASWITAVETGAMSLTNINNAVTNGWFLARFDWPPAFPTNLRPRYARLLFSPATSTHFTAGSIAFAIVTSVRDDNASRYTPANYTVS